MGLTLASGRLQEQADVVSALREESLRWNKLAKTTPLDENLKGKYVAQERSMRTRLEFKNRDLIRAQAEKLLKVRDQMRVIDYVSDLEKLRPKNVYTHQEYKDEQEGNKDYAKLYWPHKGEFWWEELNGYRVLVDDACLQQRQPSGEKRGQ